MCVTTSCELCGRTHVEVELDVWGETLTMRSCSNCDSRQWVGPDGVLDLATVLATVNDRVGR